MRDFLLLFFFVSKKYFLCEHEADRMLWVGCICTHIKIYVYIFFLISPAPLTFDFRPICGLLIECDRPVGHSWFKCTKKLASVNVAISVLSIQYCWWQMTDTGTVTTGAKQSLVTMIKSNYKIRTKHNFFLKAYCHIVLSGHCQRGDMCTSFLCCKKHNFHHCVTSTLRIL